MSADSSTCEFKTIVVNPDGNTSTESICGKRKVDSRGGFAFCGGHRDQVMLENLREEMDRSHVGEVPEEEEAEVA